MNSNGGVAFDGFWSSFETLILPQSRPIIFPLHSDLCLDCTDRATLYFRHTTDVSVLNKATNDIQQYIQLSGHGFISSSVVVVTWERVNDIDCNPYVSPIIAGELHVV